MTDRNAKSSGDGFSSRPAMAAVEIGADAQQDDGLPDQEIAHSSDTGFQIDELHRPAFVVPVTEFRKRQPALARQFLQPAGVPLRDAAAGTEANIGHNGVERFGQGE